MAVTFEWEQGMQHSTLPQGFKTALLALFRQHGKKALSNGRKSGKPVSIDRQRERLNHVLSSFETIRAGGFQIADPFALRQKHVQYLVRNWIETGISLGHMQNQLTALRGLCEWMGKKDLVRSLHTYESAPEICSRSGIATEDKSWESKGIDVEAVIASITKSDNHVGMTLRLCAAFALRRKEGSMLRPARVSPGVLKVPVKEGTKGGRYREVEIEFLWQYDLLAEAAAIAHPEKGSLIPPGYTPEQWRRRFYYILQKHGITKKELGVTTHGLRHGFTHALYERMTGVPAPIKGLPLRPDAQAHKRATAKIVEVAGHSRVSKSNAYLSTFAAMQKRGAPVVTVEQAQAALRAANGVIKHAADALGITRPRLYRLLAKATKSG